MKRNVFITSGPVVLLNIENINSHNELVNAKNNVETNNNCKQTNLDMFKILNPHFWQ